MEEIKGEIPKACPCECSNYNVGRYKTQYWQTSFMQDIPNPDPIQEVQYECGEFDPVTYLEQFRTEN